MGFRTFIGERNPFRNNQQLEDVSLNQEKSQPTQIVEESENQEFSQATNEKYHSSPLEEIISTRETSGGKKELIGGMNQSRFLEVKDDGSVIFKPRDGEREELRKEIKQGTYYKRERAAYLVSQLLDLDLVPPTVIREIDGQIGSAQAFIEDANLGAEITAERWKSLQVSGELAKLWIFDYIIYNSDRHMANYLEKNNRVVAIDNGLAFGNSNLKFAEECFDQAINQDLRENIVNFNQDTIRKKVLTQLLEELLPTTEVQACLQRIAKIAKHFQQQEKLNKDDLIPRKSDGSYDYYPFAPNLN